jgi:hypothetical protein
MPLLYSSISVKYNGIAFYVHGCELWYSAKEWIDYYGYETWGEEFVRSWAQNVVYDTLLDIVMFSELHFI